MPYKKLPSENSTRFTPKGDEPSSDYIPSYLPFFHSIP